MKSFWKTIWEFLRKLNIYLPPHTDISILGIYLRDIKAHVCIKTCEQMLTAALFVLHKLWNNLNGAQLHLPTSEWIDKLWHIHTMNIIVDEQSQTSEILKGK